MMKNIAYTLQSLVLLAGSIFSGWTIYIDFQRFYQLEGTVFKIKDCFIPNPVTTPCFYGFFAFLLAFVWSIQHFRQQTSSKKRQKHLNIFLVAANLFAWTNFFIIAIPYWQNPGGGVSCSGVTFSNPFETACFIGSVIFFIALLVGLFLHKQLVQQDDEKSQDEE